MGDFLLNNERELPDGKIGNVKEVVIYVYVEIYRNKICIRDG